MIEQQSDMTKYIRIAALITLIGNAFLASLKLIVGLLSGSGALIGDGIDSSTDVLIGVITLIVVRFISKPADAEHPWGYGRTETVATAIFSLILFFAGAQLIINSVSKLISGGQTVTHSTLAIIVTVTSIVGKALLAWSQYALGKRAGSSMINANAKNMTGDVLISSGVLVGLTITRLTGSAYADIIIAILIGAWIIKTAVSIFLEATLELIDAYIDKEHYRAIVEAANAVDGASNPHRARMRRVSGFWIISFDIDVDPDSKVRDAHKIASRMEHEIRRRLDNVYDIMIHIEPRGDHAAEPYGLSEEEMIG